MRWVALGDLDDARLHRLRLIGLAALAVLNALDALLTRAALDRGAEEVNPVADYLLGRGWLWTVKAALVAALLVMLLVSLRRRPSRAATVLLWVAVAAYAVVVAWNVFLLA